MKKRLMLLIGFTLCLVPVNPCTTFVLQTKNGLYFGRNLDWMSDLGIMVVNQRNILKESLVFPPDKSISWTSEYGSITFNQFGKEFPFGGMNEKGLVIEIMVSDAVYPEADKRPVVNELQWVQYQLDNAATVDEVIATDRILRIGQTYEKLHYLVADAEGNTAVIEFIGGKMQVYKGSDLPVPVLENDPYKTSLQNFRENESCRFTSAANLVKKYKENAGTSAIDYSFEILDEVALSAEWSVVYDMTRKEIHFRTKTNPETRMAALKNFDFGCREQSLSYDLADKSTGDVNAKFIKLSESANTRLMKKALEVNEITLETEQSDQLTKYFGTIKCKEN